MGASWPFKMRQNNVVWVFKLKNIKILKLIFFFYFSINFCLLPLQSSLSLLTSLLSYPPLIIIFLFAWTIEETSQILLSGCFFYILFSYVCYMWILGIYKWNNYFTELLLHTIIKFLTLFSKRFKIVINWILIFKKLGLQIRAPN